jgi:cytochrome b6-f complex iron-sulfur subunit
MQYSSTKNPHNRRDFLKYLLSGGLLGFGAVILYPLISYLKPPKQSEVEESVVLAGKVSDIEKGSGKIIKFGNKPVLVIKTPDDKLKAFEATCTHLDCTVQYRNDMGLIWCACHNGKYDLNGRNIAGPPPRPLDEFRVIIKGDEIYVSRNV